MAYPEDAPESDWGPIMAGLVSREEGPFRRHDQQLVAVPFRTWRVLEARLQTIRARVIEAEVELGDGVPGDTLTARLDRAGEALAIADEDLRAVLALVREAY